MKRWQSLCYASGGLVVNLFFLLLCLALLPANFFQDGQWTWLEAFLYANLVVIVENLTPQTVSTPAGLAHSDGMLLWRALLRKNITPPTGNGESLRTGKLSAIWKGIAIGLLILAAIFFAGLACLSVVRGARLEGGLAAIAAVMSVVVSFPFGIMAWKIYKEPEVRPSSLLSSTTAQESSWQNFVLQSNSVAPASQIRELIAKLEAQHFQEARADLRNLLQAYPMDIGLLVLHALASVGISAHEEAEATLDKILQRIPSSDVRKALLLAQKMQAIMWQAHFERFLATCKLYCATSISKTKQVATLDQIACTPLYERFPEEKRGTALELADFCIRRALQLAPNRVTLKGTLGGCLVERGYFDEAEPLLLECFHKGSMQDRAISSLFLGLLSEQAKRLANSRKVRARINASPGSTSLGPTRQGPARAFGEARETRKDLTNS